MTSENEILSIPDHDQLQTLRANPFGQLQRDLVECGLEPQLPVAQLIYLAKASGYAGRPLSLQIRGCSEDGKSTVVAGVMDLHPSTEQIRAMAMTWPALMEGLGRGGDLRRCVIVLDENLEQRRNDVALMAALRELTTKPEVTRVKQVGGVSRSLTLRGPAVVLDTTLSDTSLGYQDASRFLIVNVRGDKATQKAIAKLNDERFDPAGRARQRRCRQIAHNHQMWLAQLRKDLTVYKPTALHGTGKGHRFDSSLHSLVCAAAWLDQANQGIDADKSIVATADHYEYVWTLLRQIDVLAPSTQLSASAGRVLGHWQNWSKHQGQSPVSTGELHAAVAPDYDLGAFTRLLKELRQAGFAELAHRGPRGQHFLQLTLLGESHFGCDLISCLPTPNVVRSAQHCAGTRSAQPFQTEPLTSDVREEATCELGG